jgi:tetratricopeptide (TPR) repeat protein
LGGLAAFGGSVFSEFHFDDYGMLQDPAVVSGNGWARCWSWLQTRPLSWFSFWLNYQASGREAWLWHAVNVALHIACCLVLYRILRRVMPRVALAGSLIFAVHPILAESVDYVYARATVLCALFSLLALDEWIGGRDWRCVAWFVPAVLAKEECVSVTLVLALYSMVRGELRRRAAAIAAMLAISAAAGLRVMAAIQATGVKGVGANAGISPVQYLSEQGIVILRYIGLVVFPWFFSVDAEIPRPEWIWRGLAWAILAGLIAIAAMRLRDARASFWILAGLILLIPSSSIFPAADLAADRRMYLPMLAFAPAIALLAGDRARWVWVAAGVLALVSIERTYVWASDARLWGEAVALAPEKVRPRIQLARAVSPREALPLLLEGERMAPQNADVATELARVYVELGRNGEALAEAGRALALAPGDAQALNNRGAVLQAMNQTAAARRDFLQALRREPCLQEARENLERSGGVPGEAPTCGR